MKQKLSIFTGGIIGISAIAATLQFSTHQLTTSPEPSSNFSMLDELPLSDYQKMLRELENWERPESPLKVALQVGHLHAQEAPEEFPNLRNNTGASAGGWTEVDVNILIAEKTKLLLEDQNILVEILPATIPPDYWADVFVAIHADGNLNTEKSGYKAASSWRDLTGKAESLVDELEASYGETTGLPYDPNITRNMRGYYAFNWRRYEHSLHPMTVAAILETGFLTNPSDRAFLTEKTDIAASAIAQGILNFLEKHPPAENE
jgi:N-acetylmuramoyl-L-alanine amidase